jgi:hypothetical protein
LDRQGRAAAVLGAGLAAFVALAAASKTELGVIHAARWLAPGADRMRDLGSLPTECLTPSSDPQTAYSIEVGRAAFRTPLTLGGQASRAGLACDSCHRDGRGNPDFYFPGLSGAPGTADVTTALFSTHRDDGIDNPRPIPDLSGPKARLKVSQAPGDPALGVFIHGIATQEFDGAEPPPAVLAGLAAYVRALSPGACPATDRETLRAATYIANARRAVQTAITALDARDPATAAFLADAARGQLGLVYERYDQPGSDAARAALHAADLQLVAANADVRGGDPAARGKLAAWLAALPAWTTVVEREEPQSLFNAARL